MAVTLRASSPNNATTDPLLTMNVTPATLALGATAQTGDVVVVMLGYNRSADVISSVTGVDTSVAFTQLIQVGNGGGFVNAQIWFGRIASGTETSISVSGSNTSAGNSWLYVAAFSGIATSSIAGNTASDGTASGASQSTPTVDTTTPADALIVAAITGDANRTWSSNDFSSNAATTGVHTNAAFWSGGCDYRIVSANEVTNHTVGWSAGSNNTAHVIGVLHGAAGGGTAVPVFVHQLRQQTVLQSKGAWE